MQEQESATKIREYTEEDPVTIGRLLGEGRWIVRATTNDGFACTEVDLKDILKWVKQNKPELL